MTTYESRTVLRARPGYPTDCWSEDAARQLEKEGGDARSRTPSTRKGRLIGRRSRLRRPPRRDLQMSSSAASCGTSFITWFGLDDQSAR